MTNTPGDNITTKAFPFTDKALEGFGELRDELHRQEFCNRVGSLLQEHKSPEGITISIEGEWGSGKSSALAMIKSCLNIHKQTLPSESLGVLAIPGRFKRWLRRHRRKRHLDLEDCTPILVEFNPWLVGAADHMIQAFIPAYEWKVLAATVLNRKCHHQIVLDLASSSVAMLAAPRIPGKLKPADASLSGSSAPKHQGR